MDHLEKVVAHDLEAVQTPFTINPCFDTFIKSNYAQTIPPDHTQLILPSRKYIREKASNDAIRLLSLQSHPPTQPPSPHSVAHSGFTSREPSQTLLNAASTDLPPSLPTPPMQKHGDTSVPACRMKSMWERTRRLSSSLASHNSSVEYHDLDVDGKARKGGDEDEGVTMLNLDLDFKDQKSINLDSPVSVCPSAKSVEGFEEQDLVGGTLAATPSKTSIFKSAAAAKAIRDTGLVESSDSEEEMVVDGEERKPLVKA